MTPVRLKHHMLFWPQLHFFLREGGWSADPRDTVFPSPCKTWGIFEIGAGTLTSMTRKKRESTWSHRCRCELARRIRRRWWFPGRAVTGRPLSRHRPTSSWYENIRPTAANIPPCLRQTRPEERITDRSGNMQKLHYFFVTGINSTICDDCNNNNNNNNI